MKVLSFVLLFVLCLSLGAVIAEAQNPCPNIGCDLVECIHPVQQAWLAVYLNGREDVIHNGRCPVDCFIWFCDQSLSAKGCEKSANDIVAVSHVRFKGEGVLVISNVIRKDAVKVTKMIAKMQKNHTFEEARAAMEPQLVAMHSSSKVYSVPEYEAMRHNPVTFQALVLGKAYRGN